MPKQTGQCEACGTTLEFWPSQKRRFCSRACRGVVQGREQWAGRIYKPTKPRRGETTPCDQCGQPVYRNASEAAKRSTRFCSTACSNAAKRKTPVIKACRCCGTEMRLKPSQAGLLYCSRRCYGADKATLTSVGREHNGKPVRRNVDGYLLVWDAKHPGGWTGWHLEHRYVIEKQLGRKLVPTEHVDHINRDKADNRPENLRVLSPGEHGRHTATTTWAEVRANLAELEAYRRRYGPLTEHD